MRRAHHLSAVLLLLAVWLFAQPAHAADRLDATPRTLLMTAYAPEFNALIPFVKAAEEHDLNGMTLVTGELEGKPVLLMQSGVSMVNAAMNTQLALDHFAIERIVFSGIAGGVDPSLSIGDILVAESWGQYLEVSFARWTRDGWVPPEPIDPAAPKNWEFMFPRGVRLGNGAEPSARHFTFAVDPHLLETARKVASSVEMQRCVEGSSTALPGSELCLPSAPRIFIGGTGVSAGVFADNAQFREYLRKAWGARVLDMESAAVAQVAYANQVSAIFIRSLSDLAGGDHGKNMEDTYEHLASVNWARFTRAFLAALPN